MPRTNIICPNNGHDRRNVQVLLEDGTWAQGEERMSWDEHGQRWSQVLWRRAPGAGTYSGNFPEERVRDDETDYSAREVSEYARPGDNGNSNPGPSEELRSRR